MKLPKKNSQKLPEKTKMFPRKKDKILPEKKKEGAREKNATFPPVKIQTNPEFLPEKNNI